MTMTDASDLFTDTNILVYATDAASPWHQPATAALQAARRDGTRLILSPQILREYLATATRSNVTGSGPSITQILENVRRFRELFTLVEENDAVVARLASLVGQLPVAGKQVHDANIVATMQAHGISRLLTHNVAHFTRFSGLITVIPLDPSSQRT